MVPNIAHMGVSSKCIVTAPVVIARTVSARFGPSATACSTEGLWLVAKGLWLVAKGLWLVAKGLWLVKGLREIFSFRFENVACGAVPNIGFC